MKYSGELAADTTQNYHNHLETKEAAGRLGYKLYKPHTKERRPPNSVVTTEQSLY